MRSLLFNRNPLAFPAGRNAGFDPTHLASSQIRYSSIAGAGSYLNLSAGGPAAVISAGPTPANTNYGPANLIPSGGFSVLNQVVETPSAVTIAVICQPTSSQVSGTLFASNNSVGTNTLYLSALNPRFSSNSVTAVFNAFLLTLGRTYFLAMSGTATSKTLVILDLASGFLLVSSTTGGSFNITTSTYAVGSLTGGNFKSFGGYLHAVMYSVALLSPAQLLAWAKASWEFWYPPTMLDFEFVWSPPPPPPDTLATGGSRLVFM